MNQFAQQSTPRWKRLNPSAKMPDESINQNRDEDTQRLQDHVNQLMEHFDLVQIFASRHEPAKLDGTIACNRGGGNWFSRYGQITEWVRFEDERIRACARKREREDEA